MRKKRLRLEEIKQGRVVYHNMIFNVRNHELIPAVVVAVEGEKIFVSFFDKDFSEVCNRIIDVNEIL